jgi:hypothetical protein
MKKTKLFLLSLCIIGMIVQACKHDPLEPPTQPGGGTGGGTGGGNGGGTGGTVTCDPDTVYFQQQVLPIFISNCALSGCHDGTTNQEGVNLTNYNSIVSTGDVRAGRPESSEIWEMINESEDERMPPVPRNSLTATQKSLIYKWILQGAKNNSCQPATCDTTSVTYTSTIKSIVAANCQGCHSSSAPSGGIDLSTYTGLKSKVTDGRLWGAISHLSGFSPMPKNGNKLSACEIAKFKIWIDGGALNN